MSQSRMLAAALRYARAGHPVFPTVPGGKEPLGELVRNGKDDATLDETVITSWWTARPDAGVAMRTDGLVVVDVDGEPGEQSLSRLETMYGPLPETKMQRTPRGGRHLLFRAPEGAAIGNSTKPLGRPAGIDIRAGDRGYICAAPSSNGNGNSYEWVTATEIQPLPGWLANKLTQRAEPPRPVGPLAPVADATSYGAAAVEAEAEAVRSAPEGQRNERLNEAAFALATLEAGGELPMASSEPALLAAAQAAGLSQQEARKTIASGMAAGHKHPRSAPERPTARTPTNPNVAAEPLAVTAAPSALEYTRLADIEMRSIEWLDKPLLQRAAFHLVAGKKGAGKGTFLAGLASKVTRGELYGRPMNVLILASEDSPSIDILPRVTAAGGDPDRVFALSNQIQLPRDIPALEATARKIGDVGLIIIDPIGNHLGGANTDAEGTVRDAIAPLNDLADKLDCIVIGVRHLSKNTDRGAMASVLGSTAWVDVPRAVLVMARDDQDEMLFHIKVVAGNRGPSGDGRAFRIELADVGLEEPVTRAVELGTSTKDVEDLLAVRAGGSRSSAARELILDILDEARQMGSDELDARVARECGVAAKTVQNIRGELKKEGLIKVHPEKDVHGTVLKWLVYRTAADRPSGSG